MKARTARIDEHLELTWVNLRAEKPTSLTHKQAVALAGELYRHWASGEGRELTNGIVRVPVGEVREGEAAKTWKWERDDSPMDNEPAIWASLREDWRLSPSMTGGIRPNPTRGPQSAA